MEKTQTISGNNNIQVAGDYIVTEKIVKRTKATPDYNIHISDQQAKAIADKVKEIATKNPNQNLFRKLYGLLKDRYGVASYHFIPKEQFEDAMKYLSKYNAAVVRKGLREVDKKTYRKEQYQAIHAKATELHISHDELYAIINAYLKHKNQYQSLTQLSDFALRKVYLYFINK